MKTIKYGLLIVLGLFFLACDLDKYPHNTLPTDEAVRPGRIEDMLALRNGCYSYTRGLFTGDQIIAAEIMADGLHAVSGYSNTYGTYYTWTHTSSGLGPWSGFWSMINNCNYFMILADSLMDSYSATDQATLNSYKGDVYFLRALAFEQLALRYCVDYEPATAATSLGLPIKLTYTPEPSLNPETYPARENLENTYKHILSELDSAYKYVTRTYSPTSLNYGYITKEAIVALSARIALQMHRYSDAVILAQDLITRYPLATKASQDLLYSMWDDDVSTETLFQPEGTIDEAGSYGATGLYLLDKANSGKLNNPDFIPSAKILSLYSSSDTRFNAYFYKQSVTTATGKADLYVCVKYAGNPALYKKTANSRTNYKNKPKVLRMAEIYLVGAEAAYMDSQEGLALKWLNDLRRARITSYADESISGTALQDAIRTERLKEMYLEGQRIWDLKRYGMGLERKNGEVQNSDMIYLFGNSTTTALTVPAGNYKFTWPVPQQEGQTNSQFKQNPGYN